MHSPELGNLLLPPLLSPLVMLKASCPLGACVCFIAGPDVELDIRSQRCMCLCAADADVRHCELLALPSALGQSIRLSICANSGGIAAPCGI